VHACDAGYVAKDAVVGLATRRINWMIDSDTARSTPYNAPSTITPAAATRAIANSGLSNANRRLNPPTSISRSAA